jgi:hypothetical protein
MGKHPRTVAPLRTERLDCVQTHCATCGGTLWQLKTVQRTIVTLAGVIQLHLTVRACHAPACPQQHRPLRPEAEGHLVLPRQEFGLDVIAQIGAWRYRDHRTVPEMHTALVARQVPISQRSVTNLLTRYDELVALQLQDPARLRAALQAQDHVVLAIDGLQPDVGHEVLWVIRECGSGTILLARSLLSATAADLAPLLTEVQQALDRPITAVVSDGQQSIRRAVERALPGVPHQLCQFHYLREATAEIANADRHAKKELKKRVRGIRQIERTVEGQASTTASVIRGYAVAVRSALTDDGPPPLDGPGLRLHDRLTTIAGSLDRLAEKGGLTRSSPASSASSRRHWRRPRRSGPQLRRRTGGSTR